MPTTTPPAHTRAHAPSTNDIEAYPIEFTGAAGEYFRVWIVNVLLNVITLGFYTPWARKRTAQYFYGHTLVADSPLEFTAQQRKMVVGFLIVFALSVAYQLAARTGQDTAVVLFMAAGALLAPFIWASAMRFRLSNTRWRGLRLQFAAPWREVYTASWPVFALALVWVSVFFLIPLVAPGTIDAFEQLGESAPGKQAPRLPSIPLPFIGTMVLGLLLSVLCFVGIEFNYKRLLVQRSYLGAEPGRWKPVYADFLKVWAGTVGVFFLSLLVMAAVVMGGTFIVVGGTSALFSGSSKNAGVWFVIAMAITIVVSFFLLFLASAPARAYREARLFQLTWSNIGISQYARFKCRLRVSSFVWLRVRNMALTLVTLGFYRPFARVSEYRMKVESVTLHIKGGVDRVAGALVQQQEAGLGDALADAAGLDLIG